MIGPVFVCLRYVITIVTSHGLTISTRRNCKSFFRIDLWNETREMIENEDKNTRRTKKIIILFFSFLFFCLVTFFRSSSSFFFCFFFHYSRAYCEPALGAVCVSRLCLKLFPFLRIIFYSSPLKWILCVVYVDGVRALDGASFRGYSWKRWPTSPA